MLALAYAVNRAVPGAGTDHDRDNSSSFSMHCALSSGGNGAAAAAAAAVIAHAKINRSIGGSSAGGSSSSNSARGSSSGSSSTGGSSRGGGSAALRQASKSGPVILQVFLAAALDKPFRRARAHGRGLAVLRSVGVVASWACKAVVKLVGRTDHCIFQFICHLTIFFPPIACLIKPKSA